MAYSYVEEGHSKNMKSVQYFPEESDVPDKSDFSEPSYYYSPRRMKRFDRIIPETSYMNEQKCPIYVHEYKKKPSDSTYNNHSSKTTTKSKSSNSQSSRSVLDKLEETYWATWKPDRERYAKSHRKNKSKNKAYGDTSDTLVKYFQKSNFKDSSASVDDSKFPYNARASQSSRLIEMSTQEIQTEDLTALDASEYSKTAVKSIENVDRENQPKSLEIPSKSTATTTTTADNTDEFKSVETLPIKECQTEDDDSEDLSSQSKLLTHKDSFIIHKKKQEEVKEVHQQPKCIKLYKKPGPNYLRGGTYPLKSCLRNDSAAKGHFRLGPPGSPMFITSSSFNKKYGK